MISYEITSDDLVELIALACAHALKESEAKSERNYPADNAAADAILNDATEILKRTGIRYPSKFWDRCGRALDARLHLADPPPSNPGSFETWPADYFESGK